MGNAHPNLAPYQPFRTKDGLLVIAVGNDGQFRALAQALGDPALAEDARFRSNALRVEHRVALKERIEAGLAAADAHAWTLRLETAGVPCGPINTVDQVFAEPQAVARGLVVEQTRADLDQPVRTVANPIRLSKTPATYRAAPPALGADTDAVLREALGLTDEEIEALRSTGAI
jgi:crotonobetainyl-CoA:carnitine CoA-transferase CaiB-like acyl-CoA transferase